MAEPYSESLISMPPPSALANLTESVPMMTRRPDALPMTAVSPNDASTSEPLRTSTESESM